MGWYSKFLGKRGHKTTYCCPLKKCNYTSRIMFTPMDNKLSNHSTMCPKHRLPLISKWKKENEIS